MTGPAVYASDIDDNRRWLAFEHRTGDVVVSTRSKHGTTWTQLICLLLVSGVDDVPGELGPLSTVSPWVDLVTEPLPDLQARLDAQPHRRVLKTHTPLDGLPLDPRVTYVVAARHPVDAAVSLYHQGDNIDRARVAELMGKPAPEPRAPRPPAEVWLREWVVDASTPVAWLDSPAGVLHHVADAWRRAGTGEEGAGDEGVGDDEAARVVLLHFTDLVADPAREVRRLAAALDVEATDDRVAAVVAATGFDAMRARAEELAPDPSHFKSLAAFFRSGPGSSGRDLLTSEELAAFEARCRELAPYGVVDWLLR